MDKKIILLIIAIIIIIAGIFLVFSSQSHPVKNNTANNTTSNVNITNQTVSNDTQKNTQKDSQKDTVKESSSNEKTSKDPKYNSEDYVERWDSSQRDGDTWAYTHSQPTKTEDGHTYKRMYNPDTGENYWGYMY